MRKLFVLFLLVYLSPHYLSAQADSVAYSHDFEFREGFFLNFEQFKSNAPIPKSAVVSGYPKTQADFITQMIGNKYLTWTDDQGKEQKVETSTLWGYCQNRTICVNFNGGFERISVIGSLCHLTSIVNVPVGYRDPMSINYGLNTVNELRQFVLDTHTDKIFDFNVKTMETLLQQYDPELFTEFMALKKRKKNDSIFIYLRRYNDRHPLYISAK